MGHKSSTVGFRSTVRETEGKLRGKVLSALCWVARSSAGNQ